MRYKVFPSKKKKGALTWINSRQAWMISLQALEAQLRIELAAMINICCNAALTALSALSIPCPSSHDHALDTFASN